MGGAGGRGVEWAGKPLVKTSDAGGCGIVTDAACVCVLVLFFQRASVRRAQQFPKFGIRAGL